MEWEGGKKGGEGRGGMSLSSPRSRSIPTRDSIRDASRGQNRVASIDRGVVGDRAREGDDGDAGARVARHGIRTARTGSDLFSASVRISPSPARSSASGSFRMFPLPSARIPAATLAWRREDASTSASASPPWRTSRALPGGRGRGWGPRATDLAGGPARAAGECGAGEAGVGAPVGRSPRVAARAGWRARGASADFCGF